ncbi:MAG: GNAT family N-acetyltransferase [Ruminococcus sp.]
MDLSFRIATEEDLPALVCLYKSGVESMQKAGIDQWDEDYPSAHTITEDVKNGDLHLCMREGEIAAAFALNREVEEEYETAHWEKPDAHFIAMHRLCVSPNFQRQGIGRSCMLEIERYALGNGFNAIRLDTFSGNIKAIPMYKSLGFKEVGEAFWRKGRFIIFEKNL